MRFKYFRPPSIHIGSHEKHRDEALARAEHHEQWMRDRPQINDFVRNRVTEWLERELETACYYDSLLTA